MDLAGHDMMNSNQAVLSYLELIMAAPDVTPKTKKYAEKAVAHVRSSTMLVEDIRRLLAARLASSEPMKAVNLTNSIARSERELRAFFPAKKIKITTAGNLGDVYVLGESVAEYLILNMLVTLVKLDIEENVEIGISVRETTVGGNECWVLRMEDQNSQLPPGLRGDDFDSVYSKDSSVSVKITGLIFSKMIAESLGGQFVTQELVRQGERRGAALIATLRRARSP